jgi:hypothetical protein
MLNAHKVSAMRTRRDSSDGSGSKPDAAIDSQCPISEATQTARHIVLSVDRVTAIVYPLFVVGVCTVPSISALDQIERVDVEANLISAKRFLPGTARKSEVPCLFITPSPDVIVMVVNRFAERRHHSTNSAKPMANAKASDMEKSKMIAVDEYLVSVRSRARMSVLTG